MNSLQQGRKGENIPCRGNSRYNIPKAERFSSVGKIVGMESGVNMMKDSGKGSTLTGLCSHFGFHSEYTGELLESFRLK